MEAKAMSTTGGTTVSAIARNRCAQIFHVDPDLILAACIKLDLDHGVLTVATGGAIAGHGKFASLIGGGG